jgi:hypothetical protein
MLEFDADISTIDSGVWAKWSGAEFLVAHISNMKFQRALARLQQPHKKKLEAGTLDPKVNRDIVCEAMADGVLLDWKGVASKGSKEPVPYSKESGLMFLKKNPDFRDFISEYAQNLSNYRDEQMEDLGNG